MTDDTANSENGALIRWDMNIDLAPNPEGNLNHDNAVDATDIDLLYANLGTSGPTFDLNGDGTADRQDVGQLVFDILDTRFGDTNLDQNVDIDDYHAAAMGFDPTGQNLSNTWSLGDFDGDGDIDMSDISKVMVHFDPFGFSSASVLFEKETVGDPFPTLQTVETDVTRHFRTTSFNLASSRFDSVFTVGMEQTESAAHNSLQGNMDSFKTSVVRTSIIFDDRGGKVSRKSRGQLLRDEK